MEENTRSSKKTIITIIIIVVAVVAIFGIGLWYAIHSGYITISNNPFGNTKETAKELTVADNKNTQRTTGAVEKSTETKREAESETAIESEDIAQSEDDGEEDSDVMTGADEVSALSSEQEARKAESIKAAQEEDAASKQFEPINDVVTAKQKTNLRSTPNQENDDNIVASIEHGEQVNRTGISVSGWSQIDYEGQTLYAISSYLMDPEESLADANKSTEATQKQLQFTAVDEMVTAKIETNLRRVPSTKNDEDIVVMIKHGEVVRRTGIATNGWSRVEYEGQTLYAVSSLLTEVTD